MKKKILIITTGGTLACVQDEKGLVPGLSSKDILSYISDITDLYDVDFLELFQLDSANIQPSNWQAMAKTIYEQYMTYDGIVIFHGTDTMAYTSSALSFMLPNIPIPIVITGSQLSILNPLADAVENCRCAIHMAGSGMPGIFLAFNRKVILGTRASKVRTTSFHAFESINYPYVGEVNSWGLDLRRSYIPGPRGKCTLETKLEEKVFLIKLVPGFDGKIFQLLYEQGYRGLIIEAFGMGGIPTLSSEVIDDLKDVIQKGMIVVVKSQCPYEGSNLSLYETGKIALDAGVFQAYDMSTEAVVTKVMWILGKHWEQQKNRGNVLPQSGRGNHPSGCGGEQLQRSVIFDCEKYCDVSHSCESAGLSLLRYRQAESQTSSVANFRENPAGNCRLRRFSGRHLRYAYLQT